MDLHRIRQPSALGLRDGALVALPELLRLADRGLSAEAIQLQQAEGAGGHQPEPGLCQPQMAFFARCTGDKETQEMFEKR